MTEEVVPVLYVEDAARAVEWYGRLGFEKEWEHQFEPGFPWFVSVARGQVRLYLSEHKGDARPNTLIHLYALNRGILLTPFHNMALMSPATTEADVDLHTEVFDEAAGELQR